LLELRSLGKTILLSSHILTELADVCTSVGILERGRLVVAGPIHEIAERLSYQQAAVNAGHERPAAQASLPPPSARGATVAYTPGGVPIPAAAVTRRRVRLRVLGSPENVPGFLRGGPGILDVELDARGTVTVTHGGDDRLVADMVRHLVTNNIPIIGVEPERNELERIFLEATRGDLQ
jgi:ABC-2 type transport system ATP-binding protein